MNRWKQTLHLQIDSLQRIKHANFASLLTIINMAVVQNFIVTDSYDKSDRNTAVFVVLLLYNSERVLRFGGVYRLHLQGRRLSQARNQQLHAAIQAGGIASSETSGSRRATRLYNPEGQTLHSHRPENLKFKFNRAENCTSATCAQK
jgi:hypothetical protein